MVAALTPLTLEIIQVIASRWSTIRYSGDRPETPILDFFGTGLGHLARSVRSFYSSTTLGPSWEAWATICAGIAIGVLGIFLIRFKRTG